MDWVILQPDCEMPECWRSRATQYGVQAFQFYWIGAESGMKSEAREESDGCGQKTDKRKQSRTRAIQPGLRDVQRPHLPSQRALEIESDKTAFWVITLLAFVLVLGIFAEHTGLRFLLFPPPSQASSFRPLDDSNIPEQWSSKRSRVS